jgi:hypothetical protein
MIEVIGGIATVITISLSVWGLMKWWARRNSGGKVADAITNIAEDTSTWPIVVVQRKNDWPNKAQETGELEQGDYAWAREEKLGVDGREVVESVDTKKRRRLIYKHGAALTLVRKTKH